MIADKPARHSLPCRFQRPVNGCHLFPHRFRILLSGHLRLYNLVGRTTRTGNRDIAFHLRPVLTGQHSNQRPFAMSCHRDRRKTFLFRQVINPASYIVHIIFKRSFASSLPADALVPIPRLSKRKEAMPFAAKPSARNFNELFLKLPMAELPSISVGPDPAIISTTGQVFTPPGKSSFPLICPSLVFNTTFSSKGSTCARQQRPHRKINRLK